MAHPLYPPPPRPPAKRRSSKVITLSVIGVVSVMVVGYCASTQNDDDVAADCVDMSEQLPDGSYEVVDENRCDDDDGTTSHYYGSRAAYHWYYGGTRTGTRVSRGTSYRPSNVNITSRNGREIVRGGFGSGRSSGS